MAEKFGNLEQFGAKLVKIRQRPLATAIEDVGALFKGTVAGTPLTQEEKEAIEANDLAKLAQVADSMRAQKGLNSEAFASLTKADTQSPPIVFRSFDPHDVPKVSHPERFDEARLLRGAGAKFRDKGKTILRGIEFTDADLVNPEHPICAINEDNFRGLAESVRRKLHFWAGQSRKYLTGRTFTLDYDAEGLDNWRRAVHANYGQRVTTTERRNRVKLSSMIQLLIPAQMILRDRDVPELLASEVEDLTAGLRQIEDPGSAESDSFNQRYASRMSSKEKAAFIERVGDTAASEIKKFVEGGQ